MGKTTQVAADRAYDQTKTVLPAEVAQGVYMQNAPGLAALKLMASDDRYGRWPHG